MTATWCIFKKDFRRFFPLLAAMWILAAIVATAALFARDPGSRDLGLFLELTGAVQTFVMALVVVAVVQEDPVGGDGPDWRTRPIRPWELFVAKVGLILVGMVLPFVVLEWAVAAQFEVPSSVVRWVATDLTLAFTVDALALALLGAVTGSIVQAGLVFVGAFGAAVLAEALGLVRLGWFLSSAAHSLRWAVALLALLAYRYHERNLRRVAVAAIFLALAAHFVPGHLRRAASSPPAPKEARADEIALTVADSRGFVAGSEPSPFLGEDKVEIALRLRLRAHRAGREFVLVAAQSTFAPGTPEEFAMAKPAGGYVENYRSEDDGALRAEDPALLQAIGARPGWEKDELTSYGVLFLPEARFRALDGQSGRLDSKVWILEKTMSVVAWLPVNPGATARDAGGTMKVRSLQFLPGGKVEVSVETLGFYTSRLSSSGSVEFALVNRTAGEFSAHEGLNGRGGGFNTRTIRGTVINIFFQRRRGLDSGTAVAGIDQAWLRSAQLAVLVPSMVGVTTAEISIADFKMPPWGGPK